MKVPKFSVLLPSRDRSELLLYAIDSVRRQSVPNFEIIVSDNASSVPYADLIANLNDDRIKYVKVAQGVSVTENWNNALAQAKGDYVVMLGDDDALAPDYFEVMSRTLAQFNDPDVVYCAAYHYCYPQVQPTSPDGYFAIVLNSPLFIGATECYPLPHSEALALAKKALHFHHYFSFNSQHFLWKRSSLQDICKGGPFFKSPYPDFYSSIMTFLNANQIIVDPRPRIIIGISQKSFGYYYANQNENKGYEFLGHKNISEFDNDPEILPGSDHNTKWLLAAREVVKSMKASKPLAIGIRQYRRLQIAGNVQGFVKGKNKTNKKPLFKKLHFKEKLRAIRLETTGRILSRLPSSFNYESEFWAKLERKHDQHYPATVTFLPLINHKTIMDAFDYLLTTTPSAPQGNPYLDGPQQKITDDFHDLYYSLMDEGRGVHTICLKWLGHELFKCPMDLWLYQELIMKYRPDYVIETGTYRGGSAHYLATICELVGHSQVITVDINNWEDKPRPQHTRLTYMSGSSTAPEVIAKVQSIVGDSKNILVILDSDHSMSHVLSELNIYQQFIPLGGLMIVEDTNVNGHPTFTSHGPGPWEAVDAFLASNSSFVADRSLERFLLTMNPRGYLKRIAQ